jgi:iron complex outermembrane receptor protein
LWRVASDWQLTTNLTWNERAPKDYELFANGVHVATAAYEQGDPQLGLERSRHAELGLAWQQGQGAQIDAAFVRAVEIAAA